MEAYIEFLKNAAKSKFGSLTESVDQQLSPMIPVDNDEKSYPEFEWFYGDDSVDEDIIEDMNDADVIRILRNPNISLRDVFDYVYKILIDEDDLNEELSMKLVAIALERFFEELSIDHIYTIDKPYQLFFTIYHYMFVTYTIQQLALAILMFYIIKHKEHRQQILFPYLTSFKQITLNNEKSILALLTLFKYVPCDEILSVVDYDDDFIVYFQTFMKKLSQDATTLQLFGIDVEDFRVLLPYLIEDANTIRALYTKLIFNQQIGEYCKFCVLHCLTEPKEES